MSHASRQPVVIQQAHGTSGLAIAGLIFSVLGWFTFGLLSIPGAFLCLLALFARGPKGTAVAGLIVGFPGTLFFAFVGLGMLMVFLGLGGAATSVVAEAERARAEAQTKMQYEAPDVLSTAETTSSQSIADTSPKVPDEIVSSTIESQPESQPTSNSPSMPRVAVRPSGQEPLKLDEPNESSGEVQRDTDIEAAKWRTWTTANGKYKVEAKFVKFAMGTLTLEKKDGTTVDVKLDILCSEDQEFVRKRKWNRPAAGGGRPSARVLRARVVPFTTPGGVRTQMVLVDWRNTGTTTIRAVDADIMPYDARGNRLDSGAKDYAIYAVSDSSPGIAPGQRYTEPMGSGFILMPASPEAARVEIKITEVVENGAY